MKMQANILCFPLKLKMMAFLVVFQHMILKVSLLHGRPMAHMPVLFFTELVDLVLQMFAA